MSPIFPNNLTPQRQFILLQFAEALKNRSLTSNDLQFILIHFREFEGGNIFKEWGSSIAHIRRNQGWLWESAISIWATHIYYTYLDHEHIRIDPLPSHIFSMAKKYLEDASEFELRCELGDLFPSGFSRDELLATISHLYSDRTRAGYTDIKNTFYHLTLKGGIPDEDREMIRRIILAVEEYALSKPPISLLDIVDAIEDGLLNQKALNHKLSDADKRYLQLHCLVAFHDILIDIRPEAIKQLTGVEMGDVQPMAFVSCFEDEITLDIGFFELDSGFIEPTSIRSNERNLAGSRIERFYYPLLKSDLSASEFVLESDENIRLSLYNHPIRVVPHKGEHVIIAENRESTRFPTTNSRFG